MRLNLFTSLIAATTIFTSVLPASAEPYKSWINESVLATDHRAYCDDIVAQNVKNNSGSINQNNSGSIGVSSSYSNQQSYNRSSEKSGGGGFSFAGFGINGKGGSKNSTARTASNNSKNNRNSSWNRNSRITYDRSTVTSETVGENCSTFVHSAAQRDINYEQQKTNRMAIDAKKEVRLEEIEKKSQSSTFNNLMQGW